MNLKSKVDIRNTEIYNLPARLIHWIMATGFVFMWGCGYTMTTWVEEDSALEEILFDLHISVGVTLLFLLILRIAVRLAYAPPPLPDTIRRIERIGAHAGHVALYILPAVVIGVGWAEVDVGWHQVQWFGIPVAKVFPTVEAWEGLTETLHRWLAYTMLSVALVHVAAVIKHRWIDHHDILYRMI